MTPSCANCDPTYISSPAELLDAIATTHPLKPDEDLVAVVTKGTLAVVGVAVLKEKLGSNGSFDDGLEEAILSIAGDPDHSRPRTRMSILIRCRFGRTVPRPRDLDGFNSWLNSTGPTGVSAGEWFLVTQHGWRSLLSGSGPAGLSPHLHR